MFGVIVRNVKFTFKSHNTIIQFNKYLSISTINSNSLKKELLHQQQTNAKKSDEQQALNEKANHQRTKDESAEQKKPASKKKANLRRSNQSSIPSIPSFKVKAFATAQWYDLNGLKDTLQKSGIYDLYDDGKPLTLPNNCICVKAKYEEINEIETRHIFFFEDGSVIFWNVSNEEEKSVMDMLKKHEDIPYSKELVNDEIEIVSFSRVATLFDNQNQNHNVNNNNTRSTNIGEGFFNENAGLATKLHKNHIYFSNYFDTKTKKNRPSERRTGEVCV